MSRNEIKVEVLHRRRLLPVAALLAVAALGLPAAAPASGARAFHAVARHGQYLNLSLSDEGASVTFARMVERCRPGGRHQLVRPNHLTPNPIPVGTAGRFVKTIRGGGSRTRYRGFVNGGTIVVRVVDSADSKCGRAAAALRGQVGRVSVIQLDELSWPAVEAAIDGGRDTVVVAFGATEQHGHHMPLATDALLGDHFANELADRLGAFVAPTVRVGCSSHHLAFAGTLSIRDETFAAIVADLVSSFLGSGFRRIVLIPTHGGNFAPLAAAVAELSDEHREL